MNYGRSVEELVIMAEADVRRAESSVQVARAELEAAVNRELEASASRTYWRAVATAVARS